MYKLFVCVLLSGYFVNVFATITIKGLIGADTAEYGTNHSLKCEYIIQDETGVEIKWFYNKHTQIVSWIPNKNKPQAIGSFRDFLNMDESINDSNNAQSTIHFNELTFELSGDYTCKVSANDHEAEKMETMIVYQPASTIDFISDEFTETVTCLVDEMYPEPNVTIFATYLSGSNDTILLEKVYELINTTDNEFYNITKTFSYNRALLESSVEFGCVVALPNTSYLEKRSEVVVIKSSNETTTEIPDYYELTTITTISTINLATNITSTVSPTTASAKSASIFSLWIIVVTATIAYI